MAGYFDFEAAKEHRKSTNDNIPLEDVMEAADKAYELNDEQKRALYVLVDAMHGKPSNPLKRLRKIESCLPIYLEMQADMERFASLNHEMLLSVLKTQGTKANKRWSQEDDNLLIEFMANGDFTISTVAAMFGRTPGAISSRVTKLVGIGKVSQEIAGRFIGTLDGEYVSGIIEGELQKE